jgi:hypothetical protein
MDTNENIVTDRNTEGDKPANIPKKDNESRMISNLMSAFLRV